MSSPQTAGNDGIADVIGFWRAAGHEKWFVKDEAFDAAFRDRFLALHEAAARGDLDDWQETAEGALALVILLDQFPRNAFRGTTRMYETDNAALAIARKAVAAGLDRHIEPELRLFLYMPFEHSEDMADQDLAVALCTPLGGQAEEFALIHRDIIRRFGRFPHRNPILGRAMTAGERKFLDDGGFEG